MYDKDSSANTVVLYDEINYYYVDYKKRIFNRDYYMRIKILPKDGLNKGAVKFSVENGLKVIDIIGMTYHLADKIK